MNIKNVLVVEDQGMFREFLVKWLKAEGFNVLGEEGSLAGAESKARERQPDLILLDMDLPDGDGLDFVERYMETHPSIRILVVTAHLGNYPVIRLKKSGVMGVLDKSEACDAELKRAVEAIGNWRTYYSERVERKFQNLLREPAAFYKTLSAREVEMVKLFGLGHNNEWIAKHLGLSVATVQGHRRNVMNKVNVRSTPELIIWAIRNGFVNGSQIGRM